MTPGIGHNSGREDAPGRAFRRYAWGRARAALLPKLPLEVVRRRVIRARELGLPYRTYAGLRAASGDDLIGFLFSSNALGVLRANQAVPAPVLTKVKDLVDVRRVGLAQGRVAPGHLVPPMEAAYPAPRPFAPWTTSRRVLGDVLAETRLPGARTVLICDTALELEWVSAARLAGAVPAQTFFAES